MLSCGNLFVLAGSSGSSGKGLQRERGARGEEGGRKEREYYGPQNWAVKGGVNDLSDEYIEVKICIYSFLKNFFFFFIFFTLFNTASSAAPQTTVS